MLRPRTSPVGHHLNVGAGEPIREALGFDDPGRDVVPVVDDGLDVDLHHGETAEGDVVDDIERAPAACGVDLRGVELKLVRAAGLIDSGLRRKRTRG